MYNYKTVGHITKMVKTELHQYINEFNRGIHNTKDALKEKQNKFNPNFGKSMDIYAKKVEEWDSSGVSLYNDPFDN